LENHERFVWDNIPFLIITLKNLVNMVVLKFVIANFCISAEY